jgi:hypothetical protein
MSTQNGQYWNRYQSKMDSSGIDRLGYEQVTFVLRDKLGL